MKMKIDLIFEKSQTLLHSAISTRKTLASPVPLLFSQYLWLIDCELRPPVQLHFVSIFVCVLFLLSFDLITTHSHLFATPLKNYKNSIAMSRAESNKWSKFGQDVGQSLALYKFWI